MMEEQKKSNKIILLAPFLLFLAMLGVFWYSMGKGGGSSVELPSARLGKPVPAFELTSLLDSETRVTAEDLKGPLLLNVWASWCPGCYTEHGFLMVLQKRGIPIVGLNYKDERQDALAFIEKFKNPYQQIIFDVDGSLGFDLGVYGAPETYFVDSKGTIKHRHVGIMSEALWEAEHGAIWRGLSE